MVADMRRSRRTRIGVLVVLLAVAVSLPPVPTASAQPHPYAVDFVTYFGGSLFEQARDAVTDPCGNIYVTGGTSSANFPTTPGAYDTTFNGWMDVFVAKLDRAGRLLWSTFLGGPNYDRAYAIELDAQGYVYVGGRAGAGFPTTPGVLQTAFAGDTNPGAYGTQDGFVAKLTPDGSRLVWATYFGGPGSDFERDIDVTPAGDVYLAVAGVNQDHPHLTPGAFDPVRNAMDAMVARITREATGVVFATYVGGSGDDGGAPTIRVDAAGNAYLLSATAADDAPVSPGAYRTTRAGGADLLLTKFNSTGAFLWGTYFGGSGGEGTETHHLALDPAANPVIATYTSSADIPTTAGAVQRVYGGSGDAVIARISSDGATLLGATYLGGPQGDGPEGTSVDASGDIYVSGSTSSPAFPTTPNAHQPTFAGGSEMFGVKISLDLTELRYATFLGGSGGDAARSSTIWGDRTFVLVGQTNSPDFPVVRAHQGTYGGGAGDNAFAAFSVPEAPPVASAGPDQTVRKSALVTLDGTGSREPDGDCLAYAWSQVAGPPVTLANATTATPTFTALRVGLYTFELVVSDGKTDVRDTANVTVTGTPPVAALAVAPFALVGQTVEVTANGSLDADGTIVAYNFTFGDGTGTGNVPASWTLHAWSTPGTYPVGVVATDDDGLTGMAWGRIVVRLTPNGPPIADAGPDRTIFRGELGVLDGTASSDPDGDPLSYAWRQLGGPAVPLAGARSAVAAFVPGASGTYTFELTVSDGLGGTDVDLAAVVVANRSPVIEAHTPADATVSRTSGDSLAFAVDATDPDGDALTYAWSLDGAPVGDDAPFLEYALGVGTHTVRVVVSDGEATASWEWTVEVTDPPGAAAAFSWWLLVLALLVALLIAVLLWRRERRRAREAEAAAESPLGTGGAIETPPD